MLTCRELIRQLAGGEYEDAGWTRRLAVWFHLRMCRHCRRYSGQLEALNRAARGLWMKPGGGDPEALGRLERRLATGIRDRAASAAGPPSGRGGGGDAGTGDAAPRGAAPPG